ncbi:hypothetical protein KGF54_004006 [Candida jiufengensis]|uniref:uncharacterized protein n=1 Tax=Candida jiufengensis TaxID=497108 RepID=UPI0022250E9B|nr:uncharacterized protein KGF54_004006 [Candida jiufengensis]KAI5950932.1 hypothetical protein KGF54_004006 [Candida jiufengensis]
MSFLSQQEKDLTQGKLRKDLGNVDDSDKEAQVTEWQGFKLAVTDIKLWMICGLHSWLVSDSQRFRCFIIFKF